MINNSKYWIIYLIIALLFSNCSHTSYDFLEGNWWESDADVEWKIERGNFLIETSPFDGEKRFYSIEQKNGIYFIVERSRQYEYEKELGQITVQTEDYIFFSHRVQLYRITGKTNSPYKSTQELTSFFKNSIWQYKYDLIEERIYLSDSLSPNKTLNAAVLDERWSNIGSQQEPWEIKMYDQKYMLIYGTDSQGHYKQAIELDEITDSTFSGHTYYNTKQPIYGKRVAPLSNKEWKSMDSLIIHTKWNTVTTVPVETTVEPYKTLWDLRDKNKVISKEELNRNPISLDFKENHELHILRYDTPIQTYHWHLSLDGKYILFYNIYEGSHENTFTIKVSSSDDVIQFLKLNKFIQVGNETDGVENILYTLELSPKN